MQGWIELIRFGSLLTIGAAVFRWVLLFLSKIAALNDSKTALWTQQGIHLQVVHEIMSRPSEVNVQFCVHLGGDYAQLVEGLRKLMAVSTLLYHFKVFKFDGIVVFINGELDYLIGSKHIDLINNIETLSKMPMPIHMVVDRQNSSTIRALRSKGIKCVIKEGDIHE